MMIVGLTEVYKSQHHENKRLQSNDQDMEDYLSWACQNVHQEQDEV